MQMEAKAAGVVGERREAMPAGGVAELEEVCSDSDRQRQLEFAGLDEAHANVPSYTYKSTVSTLLSAIEQLNHSNAA